MPVSGSRPVDSWDEAWAEFDSRFAASEPFMQDAEAAQPRAARRGLRWLLVGPALCAAVLLAGTAQPLLATLRLGGWQDVAHRLEWSNSLPAPETSWPTASSPYLQGLQAALTEGWTDPAALRRTVALRQIATAPRNPALPAPYVRWSLRPDRWGQADLLLQGASLPELRLELGWRNGAWRVLRAVPGSGDD
jgi:hypothetical protein